jgi:hypothetical protein
MSDVTPVPLPVADMLAELHELYNHAILWRDVAEMLELAQLYAGLGYAANADSLLRRVAHEEACQRIQ